LLARNTTVQLLTFYTDPKRHNAQHFRWSDRQTDDITMPLPDRLKYNAILICHSTTSIWFFGLFLPLRRDNCAFGTRPLLLSFATFGCLFCGF